MIDSFSFQGWFLEDGSVDPSITAFWPYVGSPEFTDASTGTWVFTILGMISIFLAFVGWFYMDNTMLRRHAERLRAAGFGRRGGAGAPPPGSEGGSGGSGTQV